MISIQDLLALGVILLVSSLDPKSNYVAAKSVGSDSLSQIERDMEKEMMEHVDQNVQLELVKKEWLPGSLHFAEDQGILESTTLPVKEAKQLIYAYEAFGSKTMELSKGIELFDTKYGYNASLDTFIIVNPPAGEAHAIADPTIAAMGLRNMLKYYNVFSVNAGKFQAAMAEVVVFTVAGFSGKYEDFASAIGTVFENAVAQGLLTPEQINMMGFSYSSQLCGYIARHIAKKCGKKINSILGLEPYSIGLSSISRTPLSASDAETVHIFHTDSLGFGTFFRHGTANFIFNRDHFQPGSDKKGVTSMYSHNKAARYAWMMMLYKGIFVGRECSNHLFFEMCACESHDIATIAFPLDKTIKGDFYLNTNRKAPYGLGIEGASCATTDAGYKQ